MEARVQALRARAQREQRSFNQSLRSRKDFGNPHLIAKLSKRLGLQDGTNYPPHIYDPAFIQAEDFYDALTLQQHDWEQARQAARKGRTEVEFEEAAEPLLLGGIEGGLMHGGLMGDRMGAGLMGTSYGQISFWRPRKPNS